MNRAKNDSLADRGDAVYGIAENALVRIERSLVVRVPQRVMNLPPARGGISVSVWQYSTHSHGTEQNQRG